MDIVLISLPLIIVSGIVLFVIFRMKHKYEQGNLGKKKSNRAQQLLDSLIPLGMIFGSGIGIVFYTFFPFPLVSMISLGGGFGLLFGYVAYEIYSGQEETHSS